jgi:hypothetical protein
MALLTPKKVVLNWYQYEASLSIDLVVSFAASVEKQTVESISKYKDGRSASEHGGLDYDTWDLDSIFEEYFPSLQRRSAFLTVWSFLEHQLDQLCLFYQSEKGFGSSLMDASGKGIDRSTNYLEKVAGLKGLKASQEWGWLKTFQRIRNVITHGDGKVRDHLGNPKHTILADIEKVGLLIEDDEIVVPDGFLSKAIYACNDYFKVIEKAIYASHGFPLPDYKRR